MTYVIPLKTAVDGNPRVLDAERLLQTHLHLVENKCTEKRSSPELSRSFHKHQSEVSVPLTGFICTLLINCLFVFMNRLSLT